MIAGLEQPDGTNAVVKRAGARNPVRVRNFKGHTQKHLSESFSEILEAHLGEAKKGSIKHTEWLFEVGGVKDEINGTKKKSGDSSLASLLMVELGKQQAAAKCGGDKQ